MEELRCDTCNAHLGWMAYAGPRGWVECDSCKEEADRELESQAEENPDVV